MRGDFERHVFREAIATAQIINSNKLRKQGFFRMESIKRVLEKFHNHDDFFKKYNICNSQGFMEDFWEIFIKDLQES